MWVKSSKQKSNSMVSPNTSAAMQRAAYQPICLACVHKRIYHKREPQSSLNTYTSPFTLDFHWSLMSIISGFGFRSVFTNGDAMKHCLLIYYLKGFAFHTKIINECPFICWLTIYTCCQSALGSQPAVHTSPAAYTSGSDVCMCSLTLRPWSSARTNYL